MSRSAYSLPVGKLVGQSLAIYTRNFLSFTLLGVIVLAPWIVLRFTNARAIESGTSLGITALVGILQFLLAQVLVGAVTYGVVQHLRGQPASVVGTLRHGLSSFLRVLGTAIVCGLITGLCTLLFVLPALIPLVFYFVAIPAAVMEGKSAGGAMSRSISLTSGSRWPILGAVLLMLLVILGIGIVAGFVLVASGGLRAESFSATEQPSSIHAWIDVAIALIMGPVWAVMSSTGYFMLRQGKENVDVKQLASVFA